MTPYFERGGITIYHADCRVVLPTLAAGSVDLVLTDPPYGIDYSTGSRVGVRRSSTRLLGDGRVPTAWVTSLPRLARFRTAVYWFAHDTGIEATRQALLSIGFSLRTMLVWDKQADTRGNLDDYGRRTEYIIFGTNGPVRLNGSRDSNLLSVPRVNSAAMIHPTEKPVPLLSYLVLRSTDMDELVLDPFMGSGAALVAAHQLGRRAIGIEIEERYCEIAARRLAQGVLPLPAAAD